MEGSHAIGAVRVTIVPDGIGLYEPGYLLGPFDEVPLEELPDPGRTGTLSAALQLRVPAHA